MRCSISCCVWGAQDAHGGLTASIRRACDGMRAGHLADTDVLEGGNVGLAYALLREAETKDGFSDPLWEAGRILCRTVRRKTEAGCYRVFPSGRKQYFLPAFLRGTTGIAWVMLRYAELLRRDRVAGYTQVDGLQPLGRAQWQE